MKQARWIQLIFLFAVAVGRYWASYDKTPHQYHPSGTIIQIERAKEVSQRGHPVIGIICKNGLLIVSLQKLPSSKLIAKAGLSKTVLLDKHCFLVVTGQISDAKPIVDFCTSKCKE